ncbi:MAG: TIGR00282 family metallophosphoesterase [Myxococcales bacterium]|nr:MAG: TIGR00282 family metallophosphoesterase [Myxococcales bacterium]
MRILFIGDVFSKAGRRAVSHFLPLLVRERGVDFVVANVENLSGGKGVDQERFREVLKCGVHVGTTGNHVWQNKDVFSFIDQEPRLVRPANFPEPNPGRGWTIQRSADGTPVAVINLVGRIFMAPNDCPFRRIDAVLAELDRQPEPVRVRLLDFHAEATSEKQALSYYLDGRVSAVLGTHTHVQTADERILPRGTAAISDVGMTGPHDSVIGVVKETIIEHFYSGRPAGFTPAKRDARLHGALLEVNAATGRATAIERIALVMNED